MNRITNEQREAIVRKAVAERDALLRGEEPDKGEAHRLLSNLATLRKRYDDSSPPLDEQGERAYKDWAYAMSDAWDEAYRYLGLPTFAASPSTTRQQEVGSANGELSKPMPTLLAQRIVGALECGALWTEGSEAHPRILKTLADFNTWIVRQDAVSALSDEEIAMIARGMPMPPWGIGSRREDAIAFARKVLAAAPSTPEKAGGESDGVGGNDGVKEAPNAD